MIEETSFASWLKKQRESRQLTQAELAKQVGCSTVMIAKLEQGERRPSREFAQRLAQILELPPEAQLAFVTLARTPPAASEWSPKSAAATPQRTNLPLQLTNFIGRQTELAEISSLLTTAHLLTLTGVGGTGKTRLALHVAGQLLDSYPDGVWLSDFAPLSNAALVPQVVASALGVTEERGQPLLTTLIKELRTKRLLLIFDNCEHLIEACAQLAEALLRHAPHITLLATSRELLGVPGEMLYPLAPLSVPTPNQPVQPESLIQYDAARLFVERAQAVQPGFQISSENAAAIAEICRRLDGLPLAIELAAVRVRTFGVAQIAQRLHQRFSLLTGGSRTAQPRQQTLQALIDWSYNLLSPPEQQLLRRLSVFSGGWTLEAAAAVAGGGTAAADPVSEELYDHLELMGHLLDKSLIVCDDQSEAIRYYFLETIRHYAMEQLQATGEEEAIRDRHLAYFLALAETAEPQLKTAEQLAWMQRLQLEHDNLRAALAWSLSPGTQHDGSPASATTSRDPAAALRVSGALGRFWSRRGYLHEGANWLQQALLQSPAHPTDEAGRVARAAALHASSALALRMGDVPAACTLLEQSVALYRASGNMEGLTERLINLGAVMQEQGKYEQAQAILEEGLTIAREQQDFFSSGLALVHLGWIAKAHGRLTEARLLFEESLGFVRQQGHHHGVAELLNNLSIIAADEGDLQRAQTLAEESFALYQTIGDQLSAATAMSNLALTLLRQSRPDEATDYFRQALELRQQLGSKIGLIYSLVEISWSIALLEPKNQVWQAQAPQRQAAVLAAAADAAREALGLTMEASQEQLFEATVALVHQQLGEARFGAAWVEGRQLSLAQAVAVALEELAAAGQGQAADPS